VKIRSSLWETIAVVLILWSVARLFTMYTPTPCRAHRRLPLLLLALMIWAVRNTSTAKQDTRPKLSSLPLPNAPGPKRSRLPRCRCPGPVPDARRLDGSGAGRFDAPPPSHLGMPCRSSPPTYTGTVQGQKSRSSTLPSRSPPTATKPDRAAVRRRGRPGVLRGERGCENWCARRPHRGRAACRRA